MNAGIKKGSFQKDTAQSLLYPILFLYWKHPESFYPDNQAGLSALMDAWFFPYISLQRMQADLTYPLSPYPDVCMCGNILGTTGSIVRNDCASCKGANKDWRLSSQLYRNISCKIREPYKKWFVIPDAAIMQILSQVIYDYGKHRNIPMGRRDCDRCDSIRLGLQQARSTAEEIIALFPSYLPPVPQEVSPVQTSQ